MFTVFWYPMVKTNSFKICWGCREILQQVQFQLLPNSCQNWIKIPNLERAQTQDAPSKLIPKLNYKTEYQTSRYSDGWFVS
jgi:hypothetical protein